MKPHTYCLNCGLPFGAHLTPENEKGCALWHPSTLKPDKS